MLIAVRCGVAQTVGYEWLPYETCSCLEDIIDAEALYRPLGVLFFCTSVVLRLGCVSESPGGLVKQGPTSHPWHFWFSWPRPGPERWICNKPLGEVDAVGSGTTLLRTTALTRVRVKPPEVRDRPAFLSPCSMNWALYTLVNWVNTAGLLFLELEQKPSLAAEVTDSSWVSEIKPMSFIGKIAS